MPDESETDQRALRVDGSVTRVESQGQGVAMSDESGASRTEKDVLDGLNPEARDLLKRVLQIERSRLHLKASDKEAVDELHAAVREVAP